MNTLLRKEFRLLLPAWIAALVAASMPLWTGRDFQGMAALCFDLTLLFLALTPFGQEVTLGTFGLLLSQPEKRQRFWRIKTGLLALALVSAWALFAVCYHDANRRFLDPFGDFVDMARESGLLTLLAFSGGLWSTLLLRDVTTAFFAAVLAPVGIFIAATHCLGISNERVIYLALEVYAVAGFLAARHFFLHAQDVTWIGGQISLASARGGLFRWLGFGFRERRGRWLALVCKELQLQESTMFLVPVLALLHLAALAARHFAPGWMERAQILDFTACLWLVASLVVGCVAVAEERRYNTLEGLLCLPLRKRDQFLVKFAVVMALGTVLGGVFPWLLENIGDSKGSWNGFDALVHLVMFAGAITGISFFASTMSRGMLQGFTAALLFPILLVVTLVFSLDKFSLGLDAMRQGGQLFPSLAWPAMLAAYFWMAFRNYKSLQTGWRLWAGNFIRFVVVFVSVTLLASAIFDRSWEYLIPLEPHHGPARLNGAGRAMIAGQSYESAYVLLPDGRLWIGKRHPATEGLRPDQTLNTISGRFADVSNWVDLAVSSERGLVAIKSDGTIWQYSRTNAFHQIGSDSDWKKIIAGPSLFLALKQDGTIWGWGTDEFGILASRPNSRLNIRQMPSVNEKEGDTRFPDPVQIWQDSDWVDVFIPSLGEAMAVKRDGSLWKWGYDGKPVSGPITNFTAYHRLIRQDMPGGTNWSSLVDYDGVTLGVRTDGSLWAGRSSPARYLSPEENVPNLFGQDIPRNVATKPMRIGTKTDWVGLSLAGSQISALEADGAFWVVQGGSLKSRQPSRYHDWLAASGDGAATWTLAKDGTLSCWAEFSRSIDYGDSQTHWFALKPSRRPLASINILDTP